MAIRILTELDEPKNIQILVVEDERVVARDIKACLENLGYTVPAIATSGAEAITKAKALHPDVVLMDIRLEGEMDGTQAAQQIWDELHIPIIYSTGYSDHATVERATMTEPFGYILKPIKERDLYVAVKTALQRHQLETKLKEREQWLSTILRAIGDGVIVVDTQSRVRFLNLAAEALTGWQQEEAINQPIANVLPLINEQTQEPLLNPVTKVLKTSSILYLVDPTLLVTRDGRTIPISDSAAPLTNEVGEMTGAVLVFRDATERRLAEERNLASQRAQLLERQMVELQRLNQLKEDFLDTVSHEMRTPLASIKMAIQMLEVTLNQQHKSGLDQTLFANRMTTYLKILNVQCDQELNLVNDLLELQQIEADACPLEKTKIELKDYIPHIMEIFQERANSRQQHLEVNLPDDVPGLTTDLAILNRIVAELLTNACKYTPPGGTITVAVQPIWSQAGENRADEISSTNPQTQESPEPTAVQIRVCNTGTEISADELSRVFDKFYRVPKGDRWGQGGTGLGLALIKKLTVYLNGSIWAESSSEQVCFIVELPLIPPDPGCLKAY
jgi:PAS domain S-box-containing protein